jgi:hypothetical protein
MVHVRVVTNQTPGSANPTAGRITFKEAAKLKDTGGCSNACLPGNLTHPSNCKMGTEVGGCTS